jgi:transcriptional regulator with XRE-family HTH domain
MNNVEKEKLLNDLHIWQYKTSTYWKDIAIYIGVSPATIHYFKNGRRELSKEKLYKLKELIYK